MTCPKCNAEQPENSKFCSQCAAPLTASGQTVVVKSKTPTWLVVVILLALAFIGITVFYQSQQNQTTNPKKTASVSAAIYQPTLHSAPLTNGAATVNATSYSWYKFTVPANVTNVVIDGHFTATGGTGNDIGCYILDEDGFTNFQNGHGSGTYYNSGKVTTARIQAANLPAGTYYLVLDNRFSLLTPKAVQIQATLTYLQ
jgi:hypothetical protein